jgi:hypothetical protein
MYNTDLHSRWTTQPSAGYPAGGSEEMTKAYSEVRRGKRRSDNEGIHLKANWYNAVEHLPCNAAVIAPLPEDV